eukprot:3329880-Prymnesium_polylepis.1
MVLAQESSLTETKWQSGPTSHVLSHRGERSQVGLLTNGLHSAVCARTAYQSLTCGEAPLHSRVEVCGCGTPEDLFLAGLLAPHTPVDAPPTCRSP